MMLREKLFMGIFLLLVAGAPLHAAESVLVPTPRAKLLATSATNRPFLAAARAQQPVDLAARGYAETELLLRGSANTYDWAPAGSEEVVVPRAAGQRYVTRLLVRRPVDAGKFSGRVIVELLDPVAQRDSAPLWGLSNEHFLRRGDVWVGVTIGAGAVAALQKFDAVRYRDLVLSVQDSGCTAAGGADAGLVWDAIAQAGALLRSSSKENPLLDLNPQRLIVAGHAEAGGYVTTFANAMHRHLRLGDDAPVFDGYLTASPGAAVAINKCVPALAAGDPRLAVMPRRVPFVVVTVQGDAARGSLRRADSDAAADVFRLFEIAGVPGMAPFAAGMPAAADLAIVGSTQPVAACRDPRSDFPLGLAFNAVWQQFDDLLLQKLPMINAPRIEMDSNGNALGGWRLPQVDLPLARYARESACASGSMQRFDVTKLTSLYRSRAEYLRRFNAAVEQAVQGRRLVKEDGDALKTAMSRGLPAF
jgi:hypothetical protein